MKAGPSRLSATSSRQWHDLLNVLRDPPLGGLTSRGARGTVRHARPVPHRSLPGPFDPFLRGPGPDMEGAPDGCDHSSPDPPHAPLTRRDFLRRAGSTGLALAALEAGVPRRRADAQPAGDALSRLDPRERQAAETRRCPHPGVGVGPAGARSPSHTVRRSLPVRRPHQQSPPAIHLHGRGDRLQRPQLKGDLAESWQGEPRPARVDVQARRGVRWHNLAPLKGRELVAADIKYCFEAYAKEGVQTFTFQEIEGMETRTRTRYASSSARPTRCSRRTSPSRCR